MAVADHTIGRGFGLEAQATLVVGVLAPGGAGALGADPGFADALVVLVVLPSVARAAAGAANTGVAVGQVEAAAQCAAERGRREVRRSREAGQTVGVVGGVPGDVAARARLARRGQPLLWMARKFSRRAGCANAICRNCPACDSGSEGALPPWRCTVRARLVRGINSTIQVKTVSPTRTHISRGG